MIKRVIFLNLRNPVHQCFYIKPSCPAVELAVKSLRTFLFREKPRYSMAHKVGAPNVPNYNVGF